MFFQIKSTLSLVAAVHSRSTLIILFNSLCEVGIYHAHLTKEESGGSERFSDLIKEPQLGGSGGRTQTPVCLPPGFLFFTPSHPLFFCGLFYNTLSFLATASSAAFPRKPCKKKKIRMCVLIKYCSNKELLLEGTPGRTESPPHDTCRQEHA